MRYSRLTGLVVVVALVSVAAVASSHLRRIDLHPGACQKGSTISGTPTMDYESMTVGPISGDTGIICPFEHPTFDDDPTAAPYVTVYAKAKSGASASSSCNFQMDNPIYFNLNLSAFPAAGASGVISNGAYITMPLLSTSAPAGMRLGCSLTNGSTIGSIEIELDY